MLSRVMSSSQRLMPAGPTPTAIAIKLRDSTPISSSSDPAVIAIMIEQLDLNSGANVLEKKTTGPQ